MRRPFGRQRRRNAPKGADQPGWRAVTFPLVGRVVFSGGIVELYTVECRRMLYLLRYVSLN